MRDLNIFEYRLYEKECLFRRLLPEIRVLLKVASAPRGIADDSQNIEFHPFKTADMSDGGAFHVYSQDLREEFLNLLHLLSLRDEPVTAADESYLQASAVQ